MKHASAAMVSEIPQVELNDPLDTVLDGLAQPGAVAVAVTGMRGIFLG